MHIARGKATATYRVLDAREVLCAIADMHIMGDMDTCLVETHLLIFNLMVFRHWLSWTVTYRTTFFPIYVAVAKNLPFLYGLNQRL